MKMKLLFTLCAILLSFASFAQFEYDASAEFPYGKPNPAAPKQITDYEPMIGECDCISTSRNPDQTWAEPVAMKWRFKYILNGMGVQDETLKEDGRHSGSIRQFIADSSRWYVHYYSSAGPSTVLSVWEGNKTEDNTIVLYKEQKAPNGTDGYFRLSFYDISKSGYKWIGEWINMDKTITFPTWKIECTRKDPE